MKHRTCTCKKFETDEMPCAHAITAFKKRSMDCYEYCSTYYKTETYKATYDGIVYSVGDPETWEITKQLK